MQVERIDVLFAVLVDAAEGVEDDERVILREDFFLNLALSDAQCLFRYYLGYEAFSCWCEDHLLFVSSLSKFCQVCFISKLYILL